MAQPQSPAHGSHSEELPFSCRPRLSLRNPGKGSLCPGLPLAPFCLLMGIRTWLASPRLLTKSRAHPPSLSLLGRWSEQHTHPLPLHSSAQPSPHTLAPPAPCTYHVILQLLEGDPRVLLLLQSRGLQGLPHLRVVLQGTGAVSSEGQVWGGFSAPPLPYLLSGGQRLQFVNQVQELPLAVRQLAVQVQAVQAVGGGRPLQTARTGSAPLRSPQAHCAAAPPHAGRYLGRGQGDADQPEVQVVDAHLQGEQQLLALGHVRVGQLQPLLLLLQLVLHFLLDGLGAVEYDGEGGGTDLRAELGAVLDSGVQELRCGRGSPRLRCRARSSRLAGSGHPGLRAWPWPSLGGGQPGQRKGRAPGYLSELDVWWNFSSASSISSFLIKAPSCVRLSSHSIICSCRLSSVFL